MKEIIIKPKKPFAFGEDLKEIWQYRELLYFLTWRDIKIRYKQTAIGISWAIFQPLITMVIFNIFFGNFLQIPSDGIPYPIFVYSGLLFWQFFADSLSGVSGSFLSNRQIITKVYFPRLIIPLSIIITKFIDFLIASVILAGMMVYYNFVPSLAGILIIPILIIISALSALGLGLFLASVNVKYRDVKYVLPFFIQTLMFVTPVIYPASIAGKYSKLLALNPMTGVLKAIRSGLFGGIPINWSLLLISFATCLFLLIIGLIYYKKTEKYFADII